jgi:outer membrane biosynthesis protein TonB
MIRRLNVDWKLFLLSSLLSVSLTSALSMVPSFAASKGYQEAQPEAQKAEAQKVQQAPQTQQAPATQPVQQEPQTKQEPQAKPDTATQVLPAKTFKHQKW